MPIHSSLTRMRQPAILAAGFLCIAIAVPAAVAQDYGPAPSNDGPAIYRGGPTEEVIITRPLPRRSTIGAPIEDVTRSEQVRYDDIDLSSVPGIIAFRHRVRDRARSLCDRLAFENPVGTPDRWRCRQAAVDEAATQVDSVIHNYRGTTFTQTP